MHRRKHGAETKTTPKAESATRAAEELGAGRARPDSRRVARSAPSRRRQWRARVSSRGTRSEKAFRPVQRKFAVAQCRTKQRDRHISSKWVAGKWTFNGEARLRRFQANRAVPRQ